MSFGSAMRFEVKDGGKGGIFWQKEKPKQKPRKFGYKSKDLRHSIRRVEPEYIEEPKQKVKPSKDFIKKNREQYQKVRPDEDKENHRSNSVSSGRTSTSIKPGTVTLTQDQLNALLATVGKLKPEDASSLRISIDAENNRLKVDSPHNQTDTAPSSSRSDAGDQESGKGETSIFDLTKGSGNDTGNGPHGNRDSSGYVSEEKSSNNKEVRFDTARNEERRKTPEPAQQVPPLVPWRHMTVAERKRLQWAREKAAEEELQKQKSYDPWGRPGGGAPQKQSEPDPQQKSQFRTSEEENLRKAIDNIEAKYGDLLKPPEKDTYTSKSPTEQQTDETDAEIPGLDSSYSISKSKKDTAKASKQLEDKGKTRPPKRPDRKQKAWKNKGDGEPRTGQRQEEVRDDNRERESRKTGQRRDEKDGRRHEEKRKEVDSREEKRKNHNREEERVPKEEAGPRTVSSDAPAAPAAMQTSLFIGQSEPDNSRFLTKKEEEKRRWLEELDRQREEKRLQKQREKEKQREGLDDTWANRFVAPSSQPTQQSNPQQQQQQQQQFQSSPYTTRAAWERSEDSSRVNQAEPNALPPAAMRSAMSIGDVAPNLDRIEMKQAEEKRLWLEELNKQREEQREARMRLKDKQRASEETWASRFSQDPRTVAAAANPYNAPVSNEPAVSSYHDSSSARVSSAPQPAVTESLDDESKTYLRGQNVQMDPVTRRELEEKRRKHLEYQAAIKAQIEEKERQKREEKERKWREEMEEERKLKAERDALQRQLEAEDNKNRQKEEARQRQVEQLKSIMDAEQERAQEERMLKRLTTLQQAGHDVSGLKAHYEEPRTIIPRDSTSRQMSSYSGARAITPRWTQVNVDPSSVPGLIPSPRDSHGAYAHPNPATYRASEGPNSVYNSQDMSTQPVRHEPYTENRVLTPSRFRQPSQSVTYPTSPLREFATQTDQFLELKKEPSEVEIEYRPPPDNNNKARNAARIKSAERKKPADNAKGKPPPSKQARQKKSQPVKGKPSTWNYQNIKQKAPVKQSEKDPFYEQKRQESEERRAKRERQLQYLVELNKQVIPTEKEPRSNHPTSQEPFNTDSDFIDGDPVRGAEHRQGNNQGPYVNGDSSYRSRSPPVNRTGKYRPNNRNISPPVPTVKRKTGHNPARDYDRDGHSETPHQHSHPDPSFTPVMDERGNIKVPTKDTDFIPFTRTTDILDPSKAEEPVQLSREHTRIQQARQHYHENLRPADYGNPLDMYEDKQRQPAPKNNKNPILNPGLVKDHPTARQDQILQQLSSLKQSLIQRQREIETCMSPSDLDK